MQIMQMMGRLNRGLDPQKKRPLLVLLRVMLLVASVSAGLVLSVPLKTALAAAPPTDVLFVHGFSNVESTDCTSSWNTAENYFISHQWPGAPTAPGQSAGTLHTVGFYNNDSNCSYNLNKLDPSTGQRWDPLVTGTYACSYTNEPYFGGAYNPDSDGTYNEHIGRLACRLAWLIWDEFTSKGKPVVVVAHSMGGLIIRDALYLASRKPGSPPLPSGLYPDHLLVPAVVTLATPHIGLPDWQTSAFEWASCAGSSTPTCSQPTYMSTASNPWLTDLINNGTSPQGTGGTKWETQALIHSQRVLQGDPATGCHGQPAWGTDVPTKGDPVGEVMAGAHQIFYYLPCYTHGGYLEDSSDTDNAQGLVCEGTCPDSQSAPATWSSISHSLRAAFTFLSPYSTAPLTSDVCYKGLVMGSSSWQSEVCNGGVAGTVGQSLALQQISIRLPSKATIGAQICYSTQVQNIGWESESCDGNPAGDLQLKGWRIEAVKIHLNSAPAGAQVCYQAQVQNIGWQNTVCNGAQAGTTGQSLRLEALRVSVSWPAMNPPWLVSDVAGGGGTFSTTWQKFGGASGLGNPTGSWYELNGGQGQDFAAPCGSPAHLYFSSASNKTYMMKCAIAQYYLGHLGGPTGMMGFPTSDEYSIAYGWGNDMAGPKCGSSGGGHIYYASTTGAHEIHGCIADYYLGSLGGPRGSFGFPTTDEQPVYASDGVTVIGRYNGLEGTYCGSTKYGRIWFPNATGIVRATNGCIGQKFEGMGGPSSLLGFPKTNEYDVAGGRGQDYAGGTCGSSGGGHIYIGGGQSAHEVHGCIANVYLNNGGPGGWLG
ncbi:MAG TPA: hypothetical protein VF040_20990, partial [Ktedonobacterales bacterium]